MLYYQPKVNLRTGQVIGAEGLIRWQHPSQGLLAPAEFLPAFEHDPLVIDVGEWVTDTALTQMEQWRAHGLALPVSVNVGARQLQQPDFVVRVKQLKIDQSFVRDMLDDPDDQAILQGVIGLARTFHREVIAEGVETVAHGTLLLQMGCELAHGYGIARPMPAQELPGWAATWQPDLAWH